MIVRIWVKKFTVKKILTNNAKETTQIKCVVFFYLLKV